MICGCGQKYSIDGDKAGKAIRCPKCQARVQIPEPDIAADELTHGDEEEIPMADVAVIPGNGMAGVVTENESAMSLFEHLEAIEAMIQKKCKNAAEYLLMAGGSSAVAGAAAFAGQAGILHNNVFGNVFSGSSPFSVGHTGRMGQEGVLRHDTLGNVFSGNSPFSIGNTGKMGQEGSLHNDVFGNILSGNNPFPVGRL